MRGTLIPSPSSIPTPPSDVWPDPYVHYNISTPDQGEYPNDFFVMTGLFNNAELKRFYQVARDLGFVHAARWDRNHWNHYIVGLKPLSEDAGALFELAGIVL